MNNFLKHPLSLITLGILANISSNAMNYTQNPSPLFEAKENPIYAYMKTAYQYNYSGWGSLAGPKSTNAWFTNLAIIPIVSCSKAMIDGNNELCKKISPEPSAECFAEAWCPQRFIPNDTGTMNDASGVTIAPAVALPYYVGKTSVGGLKVAYAGAPTGMAKEQEGPKKDAVYAILWDPVNDMQLSAMEFFAQGVKPSYFLKEQSALSTTLGMTADGNINNPQNITAPLVRGSAYITMIYANLTPVITLDGAGLISVNDLPPGSPLPESNKFKITDALNNTWIVYFQNTVKLNWRQTHQGNNSLQLEKPYTGWMRLALLNDKLNKNDEATLDKFSPTIPTGGDVNYQVNGTDVNYSFNWKTNNNEAPLIFQMSHHKQTAVPNVKMNSNSGQLTAVAAKTWTMKESLPNLKFTLFNSLNEIPKEQAEEIIAALKLDVAQINNPNFFNPDAGPYTFGKHSAKLANLALIADVLGQEDLKTQVIKKLESSLGTWVAGTNKQALFYDTTFGGIVPPGDDFGALSVYNDHHFHYGYFVYTFAALAKLDLAWVNSSINNKRPIDWIKTLVRDYASPVQNDYFPRLRMQDDYDGHSWASGMVVYGDGKNQESVSEAVNSYFAIALLGGAINDLELADLGKFLLAREVKAAQTYWQINPTSSIYPADYGYYTVTNLFNAKVDAHTFFEDQFYVGYTSYGIEMLPFTAFTPNLIGSWVSNALNPKAYQDIVSVMNYDIKPHATPSQWKWILLKGIALGSSLDQQKTMWSDAVKNTTTYADFDDGDTKTNTLFNMSAYLNGKIPAQKE